LKYLSIHTHLQRMLPRNPLEKGQICAAGIGLILGYL
jgi:hypothetical protein